MSAERRIGIAKVFAIGGFLVLLMVTYWLRSEVLGLSRVRFSAEQRRSELEQQRDRDSFDERQKLYDVQVKNYEIQLEHYEKMMAVYEEDIDKYAELTKDQLVPPRLPSRPSPPTSPEVQDEFRDIQNEFVQRRHRYFVVSSYGNIFAGLAAIALVGGLLYLIMFDLNSNRLFYFLTLVLSFVFLIGPSMQAVMSAIMGLMRGPHGM